MKKASSDLALFGGTPAFSEKRLVGRPNMGDRAQFLERAAAIYDSRWLTNHGPVVQAFETRIADHLGVRHCIAVCNATIGLEVVARALGLQGEVIVPSLTFVASAHSLQWLGLTPVFCDVDPATHNLDPLQVEALLTPRSSAILGVHLWGRPCEVEALQQIAQRHKLRLFFDAAHAFGASRGGRWVGQFGDAEVFSFHATKFINSFEGGAITTNDDDLARKIRLMINFGFTGFDLVASVGTNGKMPELSAAMGLTSLDAIDEIIAVNRANFRAYQRGCEDIPGVSLLDYPDGEKHNYQYIVVEFNATDTGLTRDEMVAILWAEHVIARRYFFPGCHRMEPYRTLLAGAPPHLPHTEAIAARLIVLPTGTSVSSTDIEMICSIIRTAIRHAPLIRQRPELVDAPCS